MARPAKQGLDYFPHDTDAVNDEKIEALRALYGNDGYAFYFILLERIYRTPNFELDISGPETIEVLAKKIGISVDQFNMIMITAIKTGSFDQTRFEKDHVLTSDGIKKRGLAVTEKRRQAWLRYNGVSDAETDQETQNDQGKVKKSKVKKNDLYDHDFERFWDAYPRKVVKKRAFACWKTRIKEGNKPEDMIVAAINYASYCKAKQKDPEYIQHPSTFLGPNEPFKDWIRRQEVKPQCQRGGDLARLKALLKQNSNEES